MARPPLANLNEISRDLVGILRDPSASNWLKDSIRVLCSTRDPVDAANDTEVLAALMARRADALANEYLAPNYLRQPRHG